LKHPIVIECPAAHTLPGHAALRVVEALPEKRDPALRVVAVELRESELLDGKGRTTLGCLGEEAVGECHLASVTHRERAVVAGIDATVPDGELELIDLDLDIGRNETIRAVRSPGPQCRGSAAPEFFARGDGAPDDREPTGLP